MRQKSLKQLSILGLMLLATSVVTAAIVHTKSNNLAQLFDDSLNDCTRISQSGLTPGAGGVRSCTNDQAPDVLFSCHCTVSTLTGNASEGIGVRTVGNTSDSITENDIDTTSRVQ